MGRFIAGLHVTGSVTLALLMRAPPCDERAPFILMRPSGPRTTPGIRGSTASMRSLLLGALRMADLPIVDCSDDSDAAGDSPLAVTVTYAFRRGTWRSMKKL